MTPQIPLSENFWPLTSCLGASSASRILPVLFAVDALVPYRSRINRCIRCKLKISLVDVVLHGLRLFPYITPICGLVLGEARFILQPKTPGGRP
jgi:hypothetical protein